MRTLKTVGRLAMVAGMVMMMAAPVTAGNGKGAGSSQGGGDRTRTQSRLKDGSCQSIIVNQDRIKLVMNGNGAGDGTGPILSDDCLCLHKDYCDCMDV